MNTISYIANLRKAIEDLLTLVQAHKPEDIPKTCGSCGTPNASCDSDCADAAHMVHHNAIIRRAERLIAFKPSSVPTGALTKHKFEAPIVMDVSTVPMCKRCGRIASDDIHMVN